MNETMSALRARMEGEAAELTIDTIPVPTPAPGEVLIEVHAAGITFAELTWDETWQHAPAIPAHEFSGVVAALGPDVTDLLVGDEVYGLVRFERQGAAAEYLTVPALDLARKPATLTHAEAAAMPLAGLTAWQSLFDVADLRKDDRLLVQGGSGGVGVFAVQLAKWIGATVTATSRGDGVALLEGLGIDDVIDTDVEDFADGGRRFDVVLDTIGGDVLRGSYDVAAPGARLVTLQAPPDPAWASSADVTATFFIVSPDVLELERLAVLAERGEVKSIIAATFPLEEGAAAFASGRQTHRAPGKTVITVRGE